MRYKGCITDVPGIEVGHHTDDVHQTGCTAILCRNGAVAGVDVRGAAPGTRETDLLRPGNLVEQVHAILLSGGSAYGLDSAAGVMAYLEEYGIGLDTGYAKVPIVPGAVLFDLAVGSADIRPGRAEGYAACIAAVNHSVLQGKVGAGTGATVGKALGPQFAMRGGLGCASLSLGKGVVVGCITAVNAVGDIVNDQGQIIAGAQQSGQFMNISQSIIGSGFTGGVLGTNTTIGVLATNAKLTKAQANRLATICHDGLARAIRPCHTVYDGDTYFAVSTGDVECDFMTLSTDAAECVFRSVINGVEAANG